jgi:hypothetical protein
MGFQERRFFFHEFVKTRFAMVRKDTPCGITIKKTLYIMKETRF